MTQRLAISEGPPPMFDRIDAKFGVAKRPVMFAWNYTIYCINGARPSTALLVHERIHCDRQQALGGPENWWNRYIDDDEFRLREEVAAHIGEYETHLRLAGDSGANRQKFGLQTALRLADPVYRWPRTVGFMTVKRAKALVQRRELIEDADFVVLQAADAERVALGSMVQ